MIKIALFASGTGSNVQNIIEHLKNHKEIEVHCVLSNNSNSGALEHAKKNTIRTSVFDKKTLTNGIVTSFLLENQIQFIVLAGFLLKIPTTLISEFKNRIINLHPSLLPKYGGKGMYGHHVHQAVIDNVESASGITIHLVNEKYDEGRILKQFKVNLNKDETPSSLSKKIQVLEHNHFPQVVEEYITNFNNQ